MLKVEVAARGTGVWDLPHLDTDRCPVRFARGLFSAGDATLAGVVPDVAALVFVDEGVAAGRPESVDRAVAASRQDVRHVWVPTTLHGLVAALEAAVIGRAHVVLCDFELLRSLSDRDWCGGIAPAIEAALSRDRAFFWWLERQAEELWHRSLPAMAWVMYRTAQLRLPGPSARLGVPLVAGGARRGDAAAVSIALGVTCSHVAGGLPYLEWRRALDLLERLDLPVSDPRVATPPGAIGCGLLPRIGAGISAERLEAASMAAAADSCESGRSAPARGDPPNASCSRRACPPSRRRTRRR